MSNYLMIANLIAAALVLARAVCALNEMTARAEHHLDRIFFSILATGAVAVLLCPLYSDIRPHSGEVIFNIGAAGLLWGGSWSRHRRANDISKGQKQ